MGEMEMKFKNDGFKALEEIQSKLREKCFVTVRYDTLFKAFKVGIETDRNEYPYWIEFKGKMIKEAMEKLIEYLNGKIELDSGMDKRKPEIWFK